MYNDKLIWKVVIWVFLGIIVLKVKEALRMPDVSLCGILILYIKYLKIKQ